MTRTKNRKRYKYTDEQTAYLKEICVGRLVDDIVELYNSKYPDEPITKNNVVGFKRKHKIKSFNGRAFNAVFTDDEVAFIRANYKGKTNQELTDMLNDEFGKSYRIQQVKAYKGNNKLDSGITNHFEKGHVPISKIKPFEEYMSEESLERMRASWFKKGTKPTNTLPLWSIRQYDDGYIIIKTPDGWRPYHVFKWESLVGEIPDGHVITFIDGNPRNHAMDNLVMIDRATLAIINNRGLRVEGDKELSMMGINVAQMLSKLNRMERGKK